MRREALWDRLYLSGIDSRAAELARENGLGLEIAAFCYAPNLEDRTVVDAVRRDMAGVERFWFHAPFAELAPCAIDPLVRQVTEKRYRQAADLAQDLGVRRLVIHGGFVPQVYFPEWYVEQSVLFWQDFLRQLPQDMTIALALELLAHPDAGGDRPAGGRSPAGPVPGRGPCQHLRQPGAASGMGGPHGPVASARPPAQQRGAR